MNLGEPNGLTIFQKPFSEFKTSRIVKYQNLTIPTLFNTSHQTQPKKFQSNPARNPTFDEGLMLLIYEYYNATFV